MSNLQDYSEERFLYTVYPKRHIKHLNENTPIIRTPKTLMLNKEEVEKCIESATMYRRYSNEYVNERFTKLEIDRVHRPRYISREAWKKLIEADETTTSYAVNGANSTEEIPVVTSGYIQPVEETVAEIPECEITVSAPEELVVIDYATHEVVEPEVEVNEPVEEHVEEPVAVEENTESVVADETTVQPTEESIVEDTISEDTDTESEEIDGSEEDTDVEDEDLEAVEEDSTNQTVDSENKSSVVVNYNGKKKKHHH